MKRTAQDRHVGMLVRLAHEYPQLRDDLMPVIQDHLRSTTASVKKSFTEETEDFVTWCVMKDEKMTVNECQRILDKYGIPMQEEGVKQTRGLWKRVKWSVWMLLRTRIL